MKKGVLVFSIAVFLLAASSFALAANYKAEYKLSVVVGPNTPWGQGAQKFADIVKKETNGRINIKPYFSGQLYAGKQTNEFLLVRQGVADFALASTINWSTSIKELNLFSLPFLFPDYTALDRAEMGEPGKRVFKVLDEKGVIALGWGENGFRELTNSKRAVKRPADLEGLKIRVVGSPIFIETFKALGANPVSMNWGEAVSAFQSGTVDGQENPVTGIIIPYKLWQSHKYATIWHYTIDPLILSVGKEAWASFDEKDRAILRKAADEAMAWQKKAAREGLEGGTASLDMLKNNGMSVTILKPEDVEAFRVKTKPVYDKWAAEIGPDLVKATENAVKASAAKPAKKKK
ncbi:MAG TPA: DctP family TRAP transporter solute-binding subunit [Dissulfurispiraceae bacterium]|nr:DctP family TRAP transporter solute-binding subunit [Dissulfurispiraceae bacterium]